MHKNYKQSTRNVHDQERYMCKQAEKYNKRSNINTRMWKSNGKDHWKQAFKSIEETKVEIWSFTSMKVRWLHKPGTLHKQGYLFPGMSKPTGNNWRE